MEDTRSRLALTPEGEAFVDEWFDPKPYVVAHTSGSTGKPKEIRLLKSDMRASARGTNRFFNITAESLLLLPLSPEYIAGKMQIVRALEAGCRLIGELPSNRPFTGFESHATMVPIVPSQVESLLESGLYGRVDNMIIGGAPIPQSLENKIVAVGATAYATYGMTETCSHVALRRLGETLYRGLPGFRFCADDRGCLVIESDVMSFGRLVTNDVVEIADSQSFRWLGRFDNIINSGGVKINPEEIEKLLMPLIPNCSNLYVTSRQSQKWGQEAVIVTDFPRLDMETVHPVLQNIPKIKWPKAIVYQERLKFTPTGKIVREKF